MIVRFEVEFRGAITHRFERYEAPAIDAPHWIELFHGSPLPLWHEAHQDERHESGDEDY